MHNKSLFIRNCRVIDPPSHLDTTADILIIDGTIRAIGRDESPPPTCPTLDANGLIAAPGLIDMHVHLREPGHEYKETIRGGLECAIAGGVTAVATMPNTLPATDNPEVVSFVLKRAREADTARLYPIGAVTRGLEGRELTEMGLMQRAGARAFSDDGRPITDSSVMRHALEYAKAFDTLIIQHAEDPSLSHGGCMHEGITSARLGLPGIPSAAENVMVERDIHLCALTGGRYHVAHISTADAVAAVARARARGLPVSCEAAPHHFTLTDEAVGPYNTYAKMSPPLRSESDRLALLEGLARGDIEVIATAHAPPDPASKRVE
ncbi:MAG: dihydroorotase, partial [Magnetococcales bacterium]|nr:dihydroorotase [Magnetococcales bacterium]